MFASPTKLSYEVGHSQMGKNSRNKGERSVVVGKINVSNCNNVVYEKCNARVYVGCMKE